MGRKAITERERLCWSRAPERVRVVIGLACRGRRADALRWMHGWPRPAGSCAMTKNDGCGEMYSDDCDGAIGGPDKERWFGKRPRIVIRGIADRDSGDSFDSRPDH